MIIIPFHSKLDGLMLDEVQELEFFGSIQVILSGIETQHWQFFYTGVQFPL